MVDRQKPPSWSEFLGLVESVSNNDVVLVSKARFRLKLSDAAIAKYGHLLQVGKRVAVLVLDNGKVRVRELEHERKT